MSIERASRMEAIRGFGIDRVAAAADAGGPADRWPVLRMENLDTDLPLPPEAIPATVDALSTPKANSWLPFTGDHDLRRAIADFTAARTGHAYDPEAEIVITAGGMEAALDAVLAFVGPGDEVVLTDPTYAGLVNRVHLAGGEPRYVPFLAGPEGWRFDRDALATVVSDRTKALLLMSPSMPSGGMLDEDDWAAVAALCRERDLLLLYDAAMEAVVFDGRPIVHPLRFDGMTERTIILGSLSKEFRMIGWRVGWAAGPRELIADVGWVHVYNTTTPVGISRAAATAVLRGDHGHVADAVAELQARRDLVLAALEGLPVVPAAGGWSVLLDCVAMGTDPATVSRALLERGAVAATPMTGWGDAVAERYLRLIYSAEPRERLGTLRERFAAAGLLA
jgi:aspartate/methionine/tyrosine aminotransferase